MSVTLDPTYTGLNRFSLAQLPSKDSNTPAVVTFKNAPSVRLGGRVGKFVKPVFFQDLHGIGYSVFEDKGSVLMANIDAVLNLTEHIGGYIATGTKSDNTDFYSLLFDDHNLEAHSYIQFRRPLSVCRVLMSQAIYKTHLKTVQLDTQLKSQISDVIEVQPCDGYRIIGMINHFSNLSLRDILIFILVSFTVINKSRGKAFMVFPFSVDQNVSGTLTHESVIDICFLLSLLFHNVWFFRPYMCHEMLCLAFSEPLNDPKEKSSDEEILLALWDNLDILPETQTRKPPPEEDPMLAKAAEVDDIKLSHKAKIKLQGTRNFTRIFEGANINQDFPPDLVRRVRNILVSPEETSLVRDRVEVLSRWQLPDMVDVSLYPF